MKSFSTIFQNAFLRSSFLVFSGSIVINASNYLFNLITGRMLSPHEYGEVVALITLATILGVPAVTLTTLLAKNSAISLEKNDYASIKTIFSLALRYSWIFGLAVTGIFLLFVPAFSNFLKTGSTPLILFSLLIPASLLNASSKGTLQGLGKFRDYSIAGILEAAGKLALAILFITIGLSVNGVMLALICALLMSYFFGHGMLHRALPKHNGQTEKQKKLSSLLPANFWTISIATFLLALFANIDVVLAKHYLVPEEAGMYSALAVIGRIITYGSFSIITVMFPMVAAAISAKKETRKLIAAALGITAVTSAAVLILLMLFPEQMIKILLGVKYIPIAKYLPLFGLAMTFAALSKVFIYYFMAAHNKIYIWVFGLLTALQVALIMLFHEDIFQISRTIFGTSIALFVTLGILYFTANKNIPERQDAQGVAI
jgi:O-antigen/teichoic acid export membrane protein